MGLRKIIHVDMDAFYASVEQRDDPALKGRPVVVGGSSDRGVVAAASYEARRFGVRSAMASAKAKRLCPDLIFVRPRFSAYKEVSRAIRAIFLDYTPLVEPLALDEAYLDVTDDVKGIGSAIRIAELIRARIKAETALTASAGVSYNKFLAKVASDQNKPDGLCIIRPGEGTEFVARLPIRRFHGVGPRGAEKMAALGIHTGADLHDKDILFLRQHFGSQADYLFRAARGIDLRRVKPERARKSVSAERTFDADLSGGPALRDTLEGIVSLVWGDIERLGVRGRTITLKLRYTDFSAKSHSRTLAEPVLGREEFSSVSNALLEELLPLPLAVRLMGLGLSNIEGEEGEVPVTREAQLSLL